MKVLLVDDSRTMRNILKKILCDWGTVDVAEAADGSEALDVIARNSAGFDLVLVDWNMPVMDGLTFVRRVRETDRKTVMVMVTTEAEKSRVMEAIKAGVNNYVIKPFTPQSLIEKVKLTLDRIKSVA